jgi:hypothetical protein
MEINSKKRMSIREEEGQKSPAEILARAERLLAASHRVSNVVTFEPMTINQVHKITKPKEIKDILERKGQPSGSLRSTDPKNPGTEHASEQKVSKNIITGGKSVSGAWGGGDSRLHEENRSLRSEVGRRNSNLQGDNLSDIPDAVDVGTNVFITYFLHAVEIERLIVINKDQLEEAMEMEKEIEQMENLYQTSNTALLRSQEELRLARDQKDTAKKEHAQALEMVRHDLNERVLKQQTVINNLKNRHAEELQTKQEEFNRKFQDALVTHLNENSQNEAGQEEKIKSLMDEADSRFQKEKESIKNNYEERLQREIVSLHDRLQAQFSQEIESARRQEEEKFDNQKKIIVKELKENHEHEKQSLEAKLKSEKDKEVAALHEKIRSLEDQLLQKEKELQEKRKQFHIPPIETDRGSVDINFGSEIASPREFSRKKSDHKNFFSPNTSVINQTISQKILKAQKYLPLMTSSKQRERDRSSNIEAKSAGYAEDSRVQ